MAVGNKKLTVTGDAAAVLVAQCPVGNEVLKSISVEVNNTSANPVYVGGPGVTDGTNGAGASAANTGRSIVANATPANGTSFKTTLGPGDALYIFAHLTSAVEVFATGQ